MNDENSTRENIGNNSIPPDDTFTALLDDYIKEESRGGGTQEREALMSYFSGMVAAHNAQLDIANAEIERLKARQISPEMMDAYQTCIDFGSLPNTDLSSWRFLLSRLFDAMRKVMEGDKP